MSTDSTAALVLFSGGQDSTTCLFWALDRFDRVEAIGFAYGQRHAVELAQARAIAADLDVPFVVRDLGPALAGGSALTGAGDVDAPHALDPDLPASFVPGRNAVFLTLAAAHAYAQNIADLVGGMCQTDYSGYPDCRRVFVDATQTSLSLAMGRDLRIHTPLMYLDKAQTWKLAADLPGPRGLEAFETVRLRSHTDYDGDRQTLHAWGYGTLGNAASRLRARGYAQAYDAGWLPSGAPAPDDAARRAEG
jgi:7-cyano-7-deazaguanine synthase